MVYSKYRNEPAKIIIENLKTKKQAFMLCRHCEIELTDSDLGHGKINECRDCATEVERYVGHMVWDHKTAPALEVHANAKSLAALKDGRYNAGELIHEAKERSRRRESDVSTGPTVSLTPYKREEITIHREAEPLPLIEMRRGSGKTVATFGRTVLQRAASHDPHALRHLTGEKLALAKSLCRMQSSNIAGVGVTVWKDDRGYYVIPTRSVSRSVLDDETLRRLSFRTPNFSRC